VSALLPLLLAACAEVDPGRFWEDYAQAVCDREAGCAGDTGFDMDACLELYRAGGAKMDCDYPVSEAEQCLDAIATSSCGDIPAALPGCAEIVVSCG